MIGQTISHYRIIEKLGGGGSKTRQAVFPRGYNADFHTFSYSGSHRASSQQKILNGARRSALVFPAREEDECLSIHGFRSIRDPRLFYIHSRWVNEAAFDRHADLPHTVQFIKRVESLIDHPLDVTRAQMFV